MKRQRVFKRKAIDSETDPYLSRAMPEDMAECRGCGAVFHDKKWSRKEMLPREALLKETVKGEHLCPACLKEKEGFPEGYVTIKGGFVAPHKEEILSLLRNKEEISSHFNPLERIIGIKETGDSIEVATSTDKFAQRIGRILKRAFKGEVEYKWSSDVKLSRVVWTRD